MTDAHRAGDFGATAFSWVSFGSSQACLTMLTGQTLKVSFEFRQALSFLVLIAHAIERLNSIKALIRFPKFLS